MGAISRKGIGDEDSEDAIEDEMTTPVVPAISISHVENLEEISQHILSEFYNVYQDDEEAQSVVPYW